MPTHGSCHFLEPLFPSRASPFSSRIPGRFLSRLQPRRGKTRHLCRRHRSSLFSRPPWRRRNPVPLEHPLVHRDDEPLSQFIETIEPTLSRGMQRLDGDYAKHFNRRHHRIGPLFQGRFLAQLVDSESYLLELARYIVLNPVRARMVEQPGDWPWSSYRATAGLERAPNWLSHERFSTTSTSGIVPPLHGSTANLSPPVSVSPAVLGKICGPRSTLDPRRSWRRWKS